MSCNSESRRVINYSQQEPINNKYDLWLSENLRYNSEGSLIYDSPGQPACDLILKMYKDGDWRPIAGLSTEHIVANKINIVDGAEYTYVSPNDNIQHTNNGFQQNHLPLFRNPQDSPNELFDAGTLGNAIYGFVTESEWNNIFEGDPFSNAFTYWFPTIINNGDININDFIELANTVDIGGIRADTYESQIAYAFKPVEVKFYPNIPAYSNFQGRLSVNANDIIDSLNELWNEHNDLLITNGWKGITTQMRTDHQGIWVGLAGLNEDAVGKLCMAQLNSLDPSGVSIEWVNLSDYEIYPILSEENHENGTSYVINGGGKDGTYLDWQGNWTTPDNTGTTYVQGVGIDINNNEISCNIENTQSSSLPTGLNISLDVSFDFDEDYLTISDQYGFSQDVHLYEVFDLSSIESDYDFKLVNEGVQFSNNNPIYLKIQAKNITLSDDTNYICNEQTLSSGTYLVTIQFGVIKFEKINTYTSIQQSNET